MWRDKLREIIDVKKMYGEEINKGVNETDIKRFLLEVERELKCDLPSEYSQFLRYVNGVEFNGYVFYCID